MKNRGLLIGLALLVLVLVGVGIAVVLDDGAERARSGAETSTASAEVTTTDGADETPDRVVEPEEAGRRERRRPRVQRYVARGRGAVTGRLLEYGSDRALADVPLTLTDDGAGPGRDVTTRTHTDGSFAFEEVPNFDDWTLRADAPEPLADLELGGVVVVERQREDLGTLYLTPAFEVVGEVVDGDGAAVSGALVRAVRRRAQGGIDLLGFIRGFGSETPAVDEGETDASGVFRLGRVPPGSYDFLVHAPGFQQTYEGGVLVAPEATDSRLHFVLLPGYQVAGRVVRSDGGPLDGLRVSAMPEPDGMQGFTEMGVVKVFADVRPDGSFVLDGMRSGEWLVSVSLENGVTAIQDDVELPGTDFVELEAGGEATLVGRITDAEGEGVGGARVYVFSDADGGPGVGEGVSDGDGHYRVVGLSPGPVQGLIVEADGFATYPGDASAMFGGPGVMLTAGETTHDVQLSRGGVIRGVVLEQGTETPVAGVTVRLAGGFIMIGTRPSDLTDAEGRFELTDVPEGAGLLTLDKEGWLQPDLSVMGDAMGILSMGMSGRGPGEDPGEGVTVVVAEEGAVVERRLFLERGAWLTGVVLDPAGDPLPGAQVRVEVSAEGEGAMMSQIGSQLGLFGGARARLTDAEGRFRVSGAKVGVPVRVRAEARGLVATDSEVVTLVAGEEQPELEIRMRAGAEVSGRVTDLSGRPVSGAVVEWGSGGRGFLGFGAGGRTRTGADGGYTFEAVVPGEVSVSVTEDSFVPAEPKTVQAADGASVTLDFALDPGLAIAGRVVDPAGRPVSGADVSIHPVSDDEEGAYAGGWTFHAATSDANGDFRVQGLRPGRYQVAAEHQDWARGAAVLADAGAVDVRVALRQAFHIRGTVAFADGSAVAGALVEATDEETGADYSTETGTEGRFELDGLPAGSYTLAVAAGWLEPAPNVRPFRREGVAAGTEGLRLTVERGLIVEGSVLHADGTAAGEGWVWATAVGDGERHAVHCDISEGRFRLTGLQEGEYELEVTVGHQPGWAVVTAGDRHVEVRLRPTGVVQGRVLLADGSPAASVRVELDGAYGAESLATEEDGSYTFHAVAEGVYEVSALSDSGQGRVEGIRVRAGETTKAPDLRLE